MRAADTFTESLFFMCKLDDFFPMSSSLRSIRVMASEALEKMDRLFAGMYEADIMGGRPTIAPKKLLRATLIEVIYTSATEGAGAIQPAVRWLIGLSMDDAV